MTFGRQIAKTPLANVKRAFEGIPKLQQKKSLKRKTCEKTLTKHLLNFWSRLQTTKATDNYKAVKNLQEL